MPDYRIFPMPQQLSPILVEKLQQVETATIGHSRHWGFMDRGIQPMLRGKRIVAAAVTLAIPGQDCTLLHHALGLLRPGDIVVIDRLGDDTHACWGGGITVAAKAAGAVGAIIDGPCTDLAEIEESDFPVWSRGLSPITTRLYNSGGTLNSQISCGNVPVRPGDIVLADESGVVVLPLEEAEAIADAALARQARGADRQALVKAGAKLGDLSGATQMVLDAMRSS